MNRTAGGKWVVTNTCAEFGAHRLNVWAFLGKWDWSASVRGRVGLICLAFGSAPTLHAARVAAKRASARIQGLGYSGVKAK